MSERLSEPQRELLAEIEATGVLYVRRWSRYGRTVQALVRKGLVNMVERDFSSLNMDGYSVSPKPTQEAPEVTPEEEK